MVTYRDGISGACLLRSAQPLVGIRQHTSVNDEVLLNACRLAGSITSTCSKEQEEGYITVKPMLNMSLTYMYFS